MIAATLHGRPKFGILPSWALDITFRADERIVDATVETTNISMAAGTMPHFTATERPTRTPDPVFRRLHGTALSPNATRCRLH
jgi:hypothetical protein